VKVMISLLSSGKNSSAFPGWGRAVIPVISPFQFLRTKGTSLASKKCYDDTMIPDDQNPLSGIAEREREIMARLLRMSPEQQKSTPKPATTKGDAQRRRREKERRQTNRASGAG
jgi:hypothetical protein